MLALSDFRRRVLIFPDAPATANRSPGYLSLAVATLVVYTICNAPVDKLESLAAASRWWSGWLAPNHVSAETFVHRIIVPIKALLFGIATAWLLIPVGRAIGRALREIDRATLRRSALLALLLFALCWLLCWPYHTSMWAVGNWGTHYANATHAPFAQPENLFHRRLMKPALAYYLQFQGPVLYWVFSMLCTGAIAWLITLYIELRFAASRAAAMAPSAAGADPLLRALAVLAILSTNVVMLHLASAGYPDDLAAVFILLQIVLPLTLRERLALAALTTVTLEASPLFALAPLALVLVPTWRQRLAMGGWIAAFFIVWLASHGFGIATAVRAHADFGKTDTLKIFLSYPAGIAAGVFLAHKFLWLAFFFACWRLLRRRDGWGFIAIIACTCTALGTMPLATDTSRHVAQGFAGILFSAVILLEEVRSRLGRFVVLLICLFTIALPYLPSGGNWLELPAGGLYKAIYMYVRGWLPT